MPDIDRDEAEAILEEAEQTLERPRLGEDELADLEELVEELRTRLEEDGDFESAAADLEELLDDIDMSIMNQEPEMGPEEEREAREGGPREEEYGNIDG